MSQENLDRRRFVAFGASAAGASLLAAAGAAAQDADHKPTEGTTHSDAKEDPRPRMAAAVAILRSTQGNKARGFVRFQTKDGKISVVARITGLQPGQKHAIHIHEYGDLRAEDGTSSGGHYNPDGHEHGLVEKPMRHAGDLGNLEADDKGVADLALEVDNISINARENPILGRCVIVHEKADDGGQPTGNAGARIAHGVIGLMNREWKRG